MKHRAELELVLEGFISKDARLRWTRVACPECDCELFYRPQTVTTGFMPTVFSSCQNGHSYRLSLSIVAAEARPQR